MPSIFICYSHQNKDWFDCLSEYLKTFDILGKAEPWSDQKINIGDVWDKKIKDNLKQAKAAILLISQSFLTSNYIRNVEVPAILTKHSTEPDFVILPIILDLCLFKETTFKYPDPQIGPQETSLSIFQTANSPNKPLYSLSKPEQDRIFLSVAQHLLKVFNSHEERLSASSDNSRSTSPSSGRVTLPDSIPENEAAIKIWKQKLAFFQKEKAIVAGAAQKFELEQQIEECKRMIRQLEEKR